MRQQIAASGVGEAEYISRLLNADMALRNNPKMAIKQLAQGYGIDLSSIEETVDWNDFAKEKIAKGEMDIKLVLMTATFARETFVPFFKELRMNDTDPDPESMMQFEGRTFPTFFPLG